MIAFTMARGGYLGGLNSEERSMIASLVRDVIYLLGADVNQELDRREQLADNPDPLAEIELELEALADSIYGEDDAAAADAPDPYLLTPMDSALHRLLPDMSEDPQQAAQLRNLTEDSIVAAKVEHLTTIYDQLVAENTESPEEFDRVFVRNEDAPAWMAGLNDIRLVLAARLEVDDDSSSQQVYNTAAKFTGFRTADVKDLPEIETAEDMMAVLYAMITWWQDSLVTAVRNKELRR
ncbi:MAG: DUF2017 family protein [Trueperella sp.]|nr:DUF2017 family protein [Trueperella sp.]